MELIKGFWIVLIPFIISALFYKGFIISKLTPRYSKQYLYMSTRPPINYVMPKLVSFDQPLQFPPFGKKL